MNKDNLWEPKKNNCLFWAYIMLALYGGRVIWRKSNLWPGGFHVLWECPDGKIYSYAPFDKSQIGWKRSLLELFYYGYIKTH